MRGKIRSCQLKIVLLFLILWPLVFPFPTSAQEGVPKIGANAAVPLDQITNGDIDKVVTIAGGAGGSIVFIVYPGHLNAQGQSHFNEILSYASQHGVTPVIRADGDFNDPQRLAQFINSGLDHMNAISQQAVFVYQNEVNDPHTTQYHGNAADYANDLYRVLSAIYDQPNGQRIIGLSSNLNSSNPGVDGAVTSEQWYREMYQANPAVFNLLRGIAATSYPIPTGSRQYPGWQSYREDLAILKDLGVDTSRLGAAYIIETGCQTYSHWGCSGPADVLAKYGSLWANDPHVVMVNFFNALGKNPQWADMSFFDSSGHLKPRVQVYIEALRRGIVSLDPRTGQIKIDFSKLFKCLDEHHTFVGYTLDEKGCQTLLQRQKGPVFGKCQSQTPGNQGIATAKGQSFEIDISTPFWYPDAVNRANKKIQMLLSTAHPSIPFPKNEIASTIIDRSLEKLTPPNHVPATLQRTAEGRIKYLVCREKDHVAQETFIAEGVNDFQTPDWMELTATAGDETRKLLTQEAATNQPPQSNAEDSHLSANSAHPPLLAAAGRPDDQTPAPCPRSSPQGLWEKDYQNVCSGGDCHKKIALSPPSQQSFIEQARQQIGNAWRNIINTLSITQKYTYVITPIVELPHGATAEQNTRATTFKIFAVPGYSYPKRENANAAIDYRITHSGGGATTTKVENKKTDIPALQGIRQALDKNVLRALLPPGVNLQPTSANRQP